ncbi:MAG: c-type cytochrome domain-containing protein [Verrucomicrobiales bacterium]
MNFRKALPILLAVVAAPVFGQNKVNFEKEIWPFVEKSCVGCHKAPYEENGRTKKPKAGLRLDGAWAWVAGSESGAVFTAGEADDSEMVVRVTLPADDDDFMPPTDKADPLTPEQIELFKKWINEGADFGGWAGNLEGKPKEVSNTGMKIPVSEIQETYKKLSEGLEPLDEKAWEGITAAGGRVMPLSDSSPLVSVDFRLTGEDATDEKVGSIAKIGDNIAHLDLSKTAITDASLAQVAELKRLVRLDLHQTKVGDASLSQLKGLSNLRYLNLYGTEVSDAGLKQLQGLKNLKNVYLWNSKATEKGAKALEKALPGAQVNFK